MENNSQTTLIKFDPWSIVKIILVLSGLGLIYLLRDVIFIVLLAGFLAAIMNPAVNYFERKKIPRWLGALFIYLFVILVFISIGLAIIPTVVEQLKIFADQLPDFIKQISSKIQTGINPLAHDQFLEIFNNWLAKSSLSTWSLFSFLGTVAGRIVSVFMVFILAFYLSVRKTCVRSFINSIVPDKYQNFLSKFIEAIQREIGAWARGALLLCLYVGFIAYLGLLIIGVKFALVLALIAGLTEVIPYLGPWIGAIPAILIALTQSPSTALFVIILYAGIQQIENAFISPYVMHRMIGLDPLAVILALLIGGKLAGPMGIILAVPAATIISILVKDYLKYKKQSSNESKTSEEAKC